MDANKINVNKKSSANKMAVATFIMMVGFMLSKVSGFLRDILINNLFNEEYAASFTLAFTFPDLIYNLIIGGAIPSAVTPALAGWLSKDEEEKGMKIVSIFISVMAVVLLIVCVLGVIFSAQFFDIYNLVVNFVSKLAGTTPKTESKDVVALAAQAARFLYPQVFFMMLAAISVGILNAYKRFKATAFGPTIYSTLVCVSVALFAGNSAKNVYLCAAGVMVAALVYFIFQFVVGYDKLSKIRFKFEPSNSDFKALLLRALPILLSASIVQINVVVLNNFALVLDATSIAELRNASNIWQLPQGIFAVSVGSVMLPSLASLFESKKFEEAKDLLSSRLRVALFMTIPSSVVVFCLSDEVVRAIFQWNVATFSNERVNKASNYLTGYAIVIVIQTVVFMLNQAFYAIGNTKVPLIAGGVSMLLTPLLCTYFVVGGHGLFTITLTYTITSFVQMVILCVVYSKDKRLRPHNMTAFLVKTFGAAILAGIVVRIVYLYTGSILLSVSKIKQLGFCCVYGLIFIVIYFGCTVLLKVEEGKYWIDKVKGKLKK